MTVGGSCVLECVLDLLLSHTASRFCSGSTKRRVSSYLLPCRLLRVSTDYSSGFGGKYGVQADRVDKSAVGFDYQGKTEKHESQKGPPGRRPAAGPPRGLPPRRCFPHAYRHAHWGVSPVYGGSRYSYTVF